MRVLVHLGLNKCASTYVQHALAEARSDLAEAGCWYPISDGPPCQYGVSRNYGFGPDEDHIVPQSVQRLADEADRHGCTRMILSSEYFSLYRPAAAEKLLTAIERSGCKAEFVLFSRDVPGWIVSLFNQYVRTVEGGRYLPNIDAFVEQILRNRAVDVAARFKLWRGLSGKALKHYPIDAAHAGATVLAPFSRFARTPISAPADCADNASLGMDALYRIGQLRAAARTSDEDQELQNLLEGAPSQVVAPKGYMTISPDLMARLQEEVIAPYQALPVDALPQPVMRPEHAPIADRRGRALANRLALASALVPRRLQQSPV